MNRQVLVPWVMVLGLLGAGASGVLAAPDSGGLEEFLADTTESGWSELTIDTTRDVGTHLDVAVLPGTGVPYVSYYDQSDADLWFARYVGSGGNCGPGNSWSCQLVESTGDVGKYNSIAVRNTGTTIQVIITYLTGSSLGYSWGECLAGGCIFTPYLIQSGTTNVVSRGLYTSVEFGSNGYPYIAYQTLTNTNSGYAMIATRTFGSGNCGIGAVAGLWQCDTIMNAPGLGSYTSVALNDAGALNVAFYDENQRPSLPRGADRFRRQLRANQRLVLPVPIHQHPRQRPVDLALRRVRRHAAHDVPRHDDGHPGMVCASLRRIGRQLRILERHVTVRMEVQHHGRRPWQRRYRPYGGDRRGPESRRRADDRLPRRVVDRRSDGPEPRPGRARGSPLWTVPNCGPWASGLGLWWTCTTVDDGGAYQDEAAAVAMAANAGGMAIAYHEQDTYAYPEEGNLKVLMQQLPFFADGFESGDLSRWSYATIP